VRPYVASVADKQYRVGEVAKFAGVSIRTLHHYDQIGILRPSERSTSGYRLYSADDLLRLQQIQIGRSQGLPLKKILDLLDDPNTDRRTILLRQRAALRETLAKTGTMIASIDAALQLLECNETTQRKSESAIMSTTIQPQDLFAGFDPAQYQDEAARRWGESDIYNESIRRTKDYSDGDWRTLRDDIEDIESRFAEALRTGTAHDSPQTLAIAEAHRQHIDRWFYACSPEMHHSLAAMYTGDPRFSAHYERRITGLAEYIAAAIKANSNAPSS